MLFKRDYFYSRFEQMLTSVARARLVLDLGTYHPFRKELAHHRAAFQGRYFTLDLHCPERRADRQGAPDVVADICQLPFRAESVEAIICKEVLEHVRDPSAAVRAMHAVLKPGGVIFCTVPFLHPYHGIQGKLGDYWRFTEEGLSELFSCFSKIEIARAGGALFVLRAFSPSWLLWLFFWAAPLVNYFDRKCLRWRATNLFLVLARR